MFTDKSILITGGTGSFGKKFVENTLKKHQPKRIVVFSRDELKQSEMANLFNSGQMRYFIGDVRDLSRLEEACQGIDMIVHAAAMKQVPASEYNPVECIKTNIDGAQNVIKAALTNSVKSVIALSTDKAANPINLYGATKLASDKLFVAANNIVGSRNTRFSVVRYGNVLGSRGSIVPVFRDYLSKNVEELPITHNDMTRFVITLDQGVEFVSKAFLKMRGGEIFIPKLPSIRIVDLAEALSPGVGIRIIGKRPGEKLHEIMCPADDSHLTFEFADHFVIAPSISMKNVINYARSETGERGAPVPEGFEYQSGTNEHFLTQEEIRQILRVADV
jgi:UDP-N-acetylglucosamine 4,6-dehydratase/5-epimerase